MPDLIYSSSPAVTFAGNTFVHVPVILQFDDTPLVNVVQEERLVYTTEIPIYHSDGTYLAKVRGTRVYLTEEGKQAGVLIKQYARRWVCTVDGRPAFEIEQGEGDAFRTQAELFTPDGYFVRVGDALPQVVKPSGEALQIGGLMLRGNKFMGLRIGVLVRSDGSVSIGVP
jgi:hypothetical protein